MENRIETVTISLEFQVVIPKGIRNRLKLRPGQKIRAMFYQDRIQIVPVRPVRRMKGFLRGIETTVSRDGDRVGTSSIRTSPNAVVAR